MGFSLVFCVKLLSSKSYINLCTPYGRLKIRNAYISFGYFELFNASVHFENFRLLNYVMKGGAASANTLGVVAVLYSGIGAITEQVRSVDDEINTLFSATATGLIFRSTRKLLDFFFISLKCFSFQLWKTKKTFIFLTRTLRNFQG